MTWSTTNKVLLLCEQTPPRYYNNIQPKWYSKWHQAKQHRLCVGICDHPGFLQVLRTSQKYLVGLKSKLLLDVNKCVNASACCPVMVQLPMPCAFPPHSQCSPDRLQIHHDTDRRTSTEWRPKGGTRRKTHFHTLVHIFWVKFTNKNTFTKAGTKTKPENSKETQSGALIRPKTVQTHDVTLSPDSTFYPWTESGWMFGWL